MGRMKKISAVLDNYKELGLFLLFSLFCAGLAWSKGCLNEFGNIEFWLVLMGVVVFLLIAGLELKANKRLMLVMTLLMTAGNLIHAALEVYHFHDESYKAVNRDYIVVFIIIIAVMVIYPKCHQLLSSDIAVAVMSAATIALYGLLIFCGQAYGGVRAWIFGIQVTELIKLLFVFVIAGLLSKRQSFVRSGLAILYMAVNILCMAKISEYGTLMVMLFVFIIFLFVFPNKLWWAGGMLAIVTAGIGVLYIIGSGIYTRTLETCPPEAFAAAFTEKVRSIQNEEGETVSGVQMLREMIADYEANGEIDSSMQAVFDEVDEQLASGQLAQSDFSAAENISLTDTAQVIHDGEAVAWDDYPAAAAVTKLCGYRGFRQVFLETFCRDDFYGNTAEMLHGSMPGGIGQSVNGVVLNLYNKAMQRFVIPFLPEDVLKNVMGIDSIDTPYQVGQARKAMLIGGLTGASSHEFIYVPVMESDMVFSEIVSFFGFSMGFFIILMYMIMFREGIRLQKRLADTPFHRGVALGLSLMLFIQAMIIMAGNLGIFPLTGITLPFVSAGSISMFVCAMMAAILLTISFIEIDEQTGRMDALFKLFVKYTGVVLDKKKDEAVAGGEVLITKGIDKMKKGTEKARDLAEEIARAPLGNDEGIEEETDVEAVDAEDAQEAGDGDLEIVEGDEDDMGESGGWHW